MAGKNYFNDPRLGNYFVTAAVYKKSIFCFVVYIIIVYSLLYIYVYMYILPFLLCTAAITK